MPDDPRLWIPLDPLYGVPQESSNQTNRARYRVRVARIRGGLKLLLSRFDVIFLLAQPNVAVRTLHTTIAKQRLPNSLEAVHYFVATVSAPIVSQYGRPLLLNLDGDWPVTRNLRASPDGRSSSYIVGIPNYMVIGTVLDVPFVLVIDD
jgi:hypothetical protein